MKQVLFGSRGTALDHGSDYDGPEPYLMYQVFDGPVAAPGGKGKGGGSGGGGGGRGGTNSAPTDIQISSDDVLENSTAGTVVGTLSATDVDRKERFTFSLENDAGGTFAITGGNKLVVANGAELDYESGQTTYNIVVKVTDKAGNTFTKPMTISVIDVLETPNTAPTAISLSSTNVNENSAGGTVIGVLGNNDPDAGDSWTYQITSDPDGKFAISGNQLVVKSGAVLDFETKGSHSVSIKVTDSHDASYTQTFVIGVNDVFEPVNTAPTDMSLSGNQITEGATNGALVGVLTTTDADVGETFTYVLLDGAGGRFTLDGDRLEVANGSLIDYETATSHNVTVQVTDSAGHAYVETFTINVQDQVGLSEQPDYVQALIPATNGEATRFWPDTGSTGPTTITFAILTDFPSYVNPSNLPYTNYTSGSVGFVQLTAAQITVIYQLLDELTELVDVEFVQVSSANQAQITFGQYYMDSNVGAYAYYPTGSGSAGTLAGDIWLNSRYDTNPTTSETGGADWARSTIAHELGHAMGLKHPGNYNAGGGGTQGPYLDPAVDNGQYTTMSYTDFPYSGYDPVDYQLYDIAALQFLYGANWNHATGNDVYNFSAMTTLVDTVWDAGGYDTFSAAGATFGVTIDLNEGGFSSFGITNNIGIAYGTQIEAAVGGSGNDRLIGNALNNSFTGGAGADTIVLNDDWGFDVFVDFQNGLDLIDLSSTAFGWGSLTVSNGAGGAEIAAGGSVLTLSGIDAALVDSSDFIFV